MTDVSSAVRQGAGRAVGSGRFARREWLVFAIAAATLGAAPSPARAGEYVHYSCQTPDERSAPTEGWWRGEIHYEIAPDYPGQPPVSTSTCADVEPSRRHLRADAPVGRGGGVANAWKYTPPANTTLTRFIASRYMTYAWGIRSASQSSPGTYYDWRAYAAIVYPSPKWPTYAAESTFKGDVGEPDETYSRPTALRNLFDSGRVPWGIASVFFEALCSQAERYCEYPDPVFVDVSRPDPVAQVKVRMMQAFLTDSSPPTVTTVSGPLAGDSVHSGVERVTFDATDAGGGLYRVGAEAKINDVGSWTPIAQAIVDANGGSCVDAGADPGSDYEFVHQVPCRLAVTDAALLVDTTRLPPGSHLLRVYVEDAAGNRAPVIADRPFTVVAKNAGPVLDRLPAGSSGSSVDLPATNGSGASTRAVVRLSRTRRTVRFGRAITLTGRLVNEHDQGISGATVAIQERQYIPKTGLEGTEWKSAGNAVTTDSGTFTARIPPGPSRAIRLIYVANPRQQGYTSSAEARIAVRARASLRVLRARIRNGSAAVFVGRVAGEIPRAGVLVTLQGFVPGRGWTPAQSRPATVRARRDGRFRLSYRFLRTFARTTYRFRVLVNEDSSFAYARAASRTVKVEVRPR